MRNDSLQQFVKLRRQLTEEKSSIESRLQQINEALGDMEGFSTASPSTTTSTAPQPSPAASGAPKKRGRPAASGGGQSLREQVVAVLQEEDRPMTKQEVLAGVKRRGYKFSTSNPLNSLGVVLYGKNPKFNRVEGRFSLPGGSGGGSSAASSTPAAKKGGKRTMSPEARARIGEAQRKRWAAAGKGKSKAEEASAAPSGGTNGKPKRKMSAAGRKAIGDAARRRWAAARA